MLLLLVCHHLQVVVSVDTPPTSSPLQRGFSIRGFSRGTAETPVPRCLKALIEKPG